jgi:hypothetical protein
MTTHLDEELAMLRHVTSTVRRAGRRTSWHAATARRSSRIAAVLRTLPRLLRRCDFKREKTVDGWAIVLETSVGKAHVLTVETRTPARTTSDLNAPIVLHVHCPEFVDDSLLRELESRESVRVVEQG